MRRKILHGLQVSEFIHPEEEKKKQDALSNEKVQQFLNSAADLCKTAVDPVTQGTFVKINDTSDPKLMKIIREVCEILDVPKIPDAYICHLMYISISPYSSDEPYLVIPDYVLQYSDEDMLYYNIGNAVTMIKADHVELTTLAAYIPGGGLAELPKFLFTAYLHCADSTSDRGGLLASQSFAASIRNHFWELGIPPSESKKFFTSDEEAKIFVERYLEEQNAVRKNYDGLAMNLAKKWQNMSYLEAPANKMLQDLFEWYIDKNGYRAVLAAH